MFTPAAGSFPRARAHSHSELTCAGGHWDDSRVTALWPREDLICCGPQGPSSWRARLEKDTGRGERATLPEVWLKVLASSSRPELQHS